MMRLFGVCVIVILTVCTTSNHVGCCNTMCSILHVYFHIHFLQYAILVLILFIAKIAAIALWFTMQGEVRPFIRTLSIARKQISGYRISHCKMNCTKNEYDPSRSSRYTK